MSETSERSMSSISCIDSGSSSSSGPNRRRKVCFSTIEISEHPMIMGTSPSTSDGCPLEIDWEEIERYSLDLDEYEEYRPPRRVKDELAMPRSLRETVLLESGYTKRQINEQVRRIQLERKRSSSSSLPSMLSKLLGGNRTRSLARPKVGY